MNLDEISEEICLARDAKKMIIWSVKQMTPYELMIKANHYLIKGGMLTDAQKQNIVRQLMAARSTESQARRFYAGVKFPNNMGSDGRQMYPFFFIPPYNDGKKYKTIFN